MLLHVNADNPNARHIKTITECLLDGGVIIYPTDTIYGLGCDIFQHKAVEKICRIKQVDPQKAQLSFICYDLSDLSHYTKDISTPLYQFIERIFTRALHFYFTGKQRSSKNFAKQKKYDWLAHS